MRICIVDDNFVISDAIAMVVRDAGHEAAVCRDGASAEWVLALASFYVALVDIELPDVSGETLVRSLRMRWPSMVIILTSGLSTSNERRAEANQPTIDAFSRKALHRTELAERRK